MSFALFVSVAPDELDSPVKVRPERVFAITQDPERDDVCELHVPGGVFVVRGSVDEVSAALEAAGAPAVAPVVEVAPTDLERAAKVLDLLADSAKDFSFVDGVAVDKAIGANGIEWTDSVEKASALAARLRGAR